MKIQNTNKPEKSAIMLKAPKGIKPVRKRRPRKMATTVKPSPSVPIFSQITFSYAF